MFNSLAFLLPTSPEGFSLLMSDDVLPNCNWLDGNCRLFQPRVCLNFAPFSVASPFSRLNTGLDCHSRTTILKAESSSIFVSLLSHLVSSCICLISYRPCGEGGTLIAEVFVSNEDLVCPEGVGNGANGSESMSKVSEVAR